MEKRQLKIYSASLLILIILGIILRIVVYAQVRPLWHDECSLALSIINRNINGYFSALEAYQSAPPLFMMGVKFLTFFAGIKEVVLRFIPMFCGILSVPVFYYFSRMFLEKRYSVWLACFLFCINKYLIYYSQEFKQYSSDVLIFMLAFILVNKLDLVNMSKLRIFFCGLIAGIFSLFSLPSLFVIASFCLFELIQKQFQNLKNLCVFLVPPAAVFPIYFFTTLLPQRSGEFQLYINYWNQGFLNFHNITDIIKMNLSYYFSPNKFILFILILIVWGIFSFLKNKKENGFNILLYCISLILLASVCKLYPIIQRVSLYLVPLLIILLSKPFDSILKYKKAVSVGLILIFIIGFHSYGFNYFKSLVPSITGSNYDAREITKALSDNYKETDVIIVSKASLPEFKYYSAYWNFRPVDYIIMNLPEYNKQIYFDALNTLPAGRTYWFYNAYDYSHSPVILFLKEWCKNKNILYEYQVNNSYIVQLRL